MKKTLIAFAALALIATGCKKEKGKENNEVVPGEWLLTGMNEINLSSNDSTRTAIEYNDDNTVKELRDTVTNTDGTPYIYRYGFTYSNGNVVKKTWHETGLAAPETDMEAFYEGNRLVRVDHWDYRSDGTPGSELNNYDSLVYLQGKITELYNKSVKGHGTNKYKLTWEGENVKSVERFSEKPDGTFEFRAATNYTYDNKPSLYSIFKVNIFWFHETTMFELLSANNMVKQEIVFQGAVTERFTNEYKLNGEGRIVELHSSSQYLNGEPTLYKTLVQYTEK